MNYNTYEQKFRKKAVDTGYSEYNIMKCLEYAKKLLDRGFPVIYNSSHLSSLVGYKRSYLKRAFYSTKYFYRKFKVKKKNGKKREICEPLPSLKEIQHWILSSILYKHEVSKFAKAYIPKRKITDNVRFHKGQEKVICVDIVNFFPTITEGKVNEIFQNMGYSNRVSVILSRLCCLEGCLPQGAPTSPQLSNIYMLNFDKKLSTFSLKNNYRYTRYADDLTFSGEIDVKELMEKVGIELAGLNLELNSDKTKVMTKGMRQVVTGIVVNKTNQVPIEKRRELRQAIYYIEKFGLASHLSRIKCSKSNYIKHLLGKVNYVLFINPKDKEAREQKKFLVNVLNEKTEIKEVKK